MATVVLGGAGKVFAKLLLKTLVNSMSVDIMPETQCGFRDNVSIIDMMIAAKQPMVKWTVLQKNGLPAKMHTSSKRIV